MRCWPFWTEVQTMLLIWGLKAPTALLAQAGDLPPAGYGTLRQDQVGVRITTSGVMVRAIPLDERVIRLLAADAYRSLHELAASRSADIAQSAR